MQMSLGVPGALVRDRRQHPCTHPAALASLCTMGLGRSMMSWGAWAAGHLAARLRADVGAQAGRRRAGRRAALQRLPAAHRGRQLVVRGVAA